MDDAKILITEIETYCRRAGVAESTFGRQVVNDGKFVRRIREGKRVTSATIDKIRAFIAANSGDADTTAPAAPTGNGSTPHHGAGVPAPVPAATAPATADPADTNSTGRTFRFYDNRQKYLMFVNTCSEKWVVADRVGMELSHHPSAAAGAARVRCRHGRRHGAHARHAQDARALPDRAVLHRRQGDQPRGRAAHPREDAGPVLRASGDGAGRHQPLLHRGAGADAALDGGGGIAQLERGAARAARPPHDFDEQIKALQPVSGRGLAGARRAPRPAIRFMCARRCWCSIARITRSCSTRSSRARAMRAPTTI